MGHTCIWRIGAALVGVAIGPGVALAQAPVSLHMTYDTYAAGLQVAQVEAGFGLGPYTYQMNLAYHTTGMVGLFFRGHQLNTVTGSWHGTLPAPLEFFGTGVWRGQQRVVKIDYMQGVPIIRELAPPNEEEREQVPDALRANSVDTLSALAALIHTVDSTGRCDADMRTYDGRRATEIRAVTVGEETLEQTSRSSFAGRALRCDFAGRMLSGFVFGDDDVKKHSQPMHGSAWLASVVPGGPPVPVRMAFETRWFGDATMYLTGVRPGFELSANALAP